MKVKNLLKKVGSVITTAALLATLGTTAFAGGVDVKKEVAEGGNVNITGVTATDKGNDVYEIKVDYTTTIDNKVGMTMLTYRASGEDGKPADTALSTKYSDKMQIVGIAQSADNKAKDSSGSFIFNVTTKQGEDTTNKYYIQKGKKVLIAVSGDQCTPAYATFSLNAKAASAKCTLGSSDQPVPIYADQDLNQELNGMVKADKIVFYENNEPIENTTADLSGVDFSSVTWTKDSSGVYKATVTLPKANISGVDIEGDSINVELTAYVKIQAVSGTVTKLGSATVENNAATISVNNSVLKDATDLSNLTTYLTNNYKSVQLTAGDLTDTIENGASFEPSDTYGAGKTSYTYTATVNVGTGKNGNVKLDANQSITVTVNITSDSITDVKLMKDNAEVTGELDSVQVPSGTTEANIASAVKEKLSGYSLSYTENKDGSTEQKTIALTDNKVGYTSAVKDGKVTFTINTIDGIALVSPFSVVVPYTIAPAGVPVYLGDVNMDGEVNGRDWQLIMFHNNNLNPIPALKDKTSVQYKAANINNDDEINGQDWQLIMFHNNNLNPNPDIGKKIVGYKSAE